MQIWIYRQVFLTFAQELLDLATVECDTYACPKPLIKSGELVNKILSNIYSNNLRKQVSGTRRKNQVSAFK